MQKDINPEHIPVLVDELIELLSIDKQKPQLIVDCTVGLGGHAKAVLSRACPESKFIGLDIDPSSLEVAKENLKGFKQDIQLINANFGNIVKVLRHLNIDKVDVIYADLGLNSWQLSQAERGFSFQLDGPLDMRMNPTLPKSAADLVNTLKESELIKIFKEYGEEKLAKAIAKLIMQSRKKQRIERTSQLAEIVCRAYKVDPDKVSSYRIHPATKVFQALRIAVNQELDNLATLLKSAPYVLSSGGRIAIISFHSLEDRLIKQNFKENEEKGIYRILTDKPIKPSSSEIIRNPRARSSKLRAAEKL